ncbi:MAG: DUF4380 domain-containing protein [Ginsengibacter sp.]
MSYKNTSGMLKVNLIRTGFIWLFTLMILNDHIIAQKQVLAPIKTKGNYFTIKAGKSTIQIDPQKGGRIRTLTYNGVNFLTDSTIHSNYYGSILWISPEDKWGEPEKIDRKPYSVSLHKNYLVLTSPYDSKAGLVVKKFFSGDRTRDCFNIKYTVFNKSDTTQNLAPWEVTRVHINGIALFPMGEGNLRGGLLSSMSIKDKIAWFVYDTSKVPRTGNRQIYSDGHEGWIAEINGNWLLVQQSEDVPIENTAPNEGEMELYASPVKDGTGYVEIEHQGKYVSLLPGKSVTWNVNWYLRKIPRSIRPKAGSADLLAYIRDLIKK